MDKFSKFLEKLKNEENAPLIESVKRGYKVCFESEESSEFDSDILENNLTRDGGKIIVTILPKNISWYSKYPKITEILLKAHAKSHPNDESSAEDILSDTFFEVRSHIETDVSPDGDHSGDWEIIEENPSKSTHKYYVVVGGSTKSEYDITELPEFAEIIDNIDSEAESFRNKIYEEMGEYKSNPSNMKYYVRD